MFRKFENVTVSVNVPCEKLLLLGFCHEKQLELKSAADKPSMLMLAGAPICSAAGGF